jgi:hypothetical protein
MASVVSPVTLVCTTQTGYRARGLSGVSDTRAGLAGSLADDRVHDRLALTAAGLQDVPVHHLEHGGT